MQTSPGPINVGCLTVSNPLKAKSSFSCKTKEEVQHPHYGSKLLEEQSIGPGKRTSAHQGKDNVVINSGSSKLEQKQAHPQ